MSLSSINVAALCQVNRIADLEALNAQVNPLFFPASDASDSETDVQNYSSAVLGKFYDLAKGQGMAAPSHGDSWNWGRAHFEEHTALRTAAILHVVAERCFFMIPLLEQELRTSTRAVEILSNPAGSTVRSAAPTAHNIDIDTLRRQVKDDISAADLENVVGRILPVFTELHGRIKTASDEVARLKAPLGPMAGCLTPEQRTRSAPSSPPSLLSLDANSRGSSIARSRNSSVASGSTTSLEGTSNSLHP